MYHVNRFSNRSIIFIVCLSYAIVGHAASKVAQTESSTSKTESKAAQSSDDKTTSSVEIIKTPDGQKVITRSGGSTDITIQSNSSTKQVTTDKDSSASKSSKSGKTGSISTQKEFKERIMGRMRSLTHK